MLPEMYIKTNYLEIECKAISFIKAIRIMKRSPVQRTEQPNKVDYFLKELNVRRPSSPGLRSSGLSLEKMPHLENKADSSHKARNRFALENRSVSELSGRLGSLDLNNGRRLTHESPSLEITSMKKTNRLKLPKLEPPENELISSLNEPHSERKTPTNNGSLTIDMKKKRLQPLKQQKLKFSSKTKAGSNGNQTKINQDVAICDTRLAHGLKMFCVCDGHGLNGHLVSSFIRVQLVKNLNKLLKRKQDKPENVVPIIQEAFELTNNELLGSQINTDLSGSTVVATFIYDDNLYCFNVGDSRALLVSKVANEWKLKPLSDDQKPSREDEKQRIIKAGGRIEAQTDESGNPIGPLRVWMATLQLPGLAMTRSFGDKAGVRAGTNGVPEITHHKLAAQDKLIVVASDGVWEYIENEEITQILIPFLTEKPNLDMACQRIVSHAAAVWRKVCLSRDDITVILVSLQDSDFP